MDMQGGKTLLHFASFHPTYVKSRENLSTQDNIFNKYW